MSLADLAAILGLAVLAVVYVGFRLGERGGCPGGCGGPGGRCGEGRGDACDREAGGPETATGGAAGEPIEPQGRRRR